MRCVRGTVWGAAVAAGTCASGARGVVTHIVEPDDFPSGTFIVNSYPGVTLHTDNPNGNVVVATSSLAPTGQRVFNQGSIPPFPWTDTSGSGHIFIADFDAPVNFVSIKMFVQDIFSQGIGRLEAYNGSGTLLTSVNTGNILFQQPQDVTIDWPAGDIRRIRAFGTAGWAVGLDRMTFVNTPAPGAAVLLGMAGFAACGRRRRGG